MTGNDVPVPQGFGRDRSERLAMPPYDRLDEKQRAAADALINGPRKGVSGPFVPLMQSPQLLDRLAKVGEHLRFHSVLPTRTAEFVMLIVSRELSNQFEWAIHLPIALAAGVARETVAELVEGSRPATMSPEEALAYDITLEVMHRHGVADTAYRRAVAQWGTAGVVELTALIGYFTTVCWIMNVARTPAPGGVEGGALGGFPG